jgi:hypothetical protein
MPVTHLSMPYIPVAPRVVLLVADGALYGGAQHHHAAVAHRKLGVLERVDGRLGRRRTHMHTSVTSHNHTENACMSAENGGARTRRWPPEAQPHTHEHTCTHANTRNQMLTCQQQMGVLECVDGRSGRRHACTQQHTRKRVETPRNDVTSAHGHWRSDVIREAGKLCSSAKRRYVMHTIELP